MSRHWAYFLSVSKVGKNTHIFSVTQSSRPKPDHPPHTVSTQHRSLVHNRCKSVFGAAWQDVISLLH